MPRTKSDLTVKDLRARAKAAYAGGKGNQALKGYHKMKKDALENALGISRAAKSAVAPKKKAAKPTLTAKRYESAKQSKAIAVALKNKLGLDDAGVEEVEKHLRDGIKKAIDKRRQQNPDASSQELRAAALRAVRSTISRFKKPQVQSKENSHLQPSKTDNAKNKVERGDSVPLIRHEDGVRIKAIPSDLAKPLDINEKERKNMAGDRYKYEINDPHKFTFEDYKKSWIEQTANTDIKALKGRHKSQVWKALSQGKHVPNDVLLDYPELAAKYKKSDDQEQKQSYTSKMLPGEKDKHWRYTDEGEKFAQKADDITGDAEAKGIRISEDDYKRLHKGDAELLQNIKSQIAEKVKQGVTTTRADARRAARKQVERIQSQIKSIVTEHEKLSATVSNLKDKIADRAGKSALKRHKKGGSAADMSDGMGAKNMSPETRKKVKQAEERLARMERAMQHLDDKARHIRRDFDFSVDDKRPAQQSSPPAKKQVSSQKTSDQNTHDENFSDFDKALYGTPKKKARKLAEIDAEKKKKEEAALTSQKQAAIVPEHEQKVTKEEYEALKEEGKKFYTEVDMARSKLKPERKIISLATPTGKNLDTEAEVYNDHWALHKPTNENSSKKGYMVTHVPSGMSLEKVKDLTEGRRIIHRLLNEVSLKSPKLGAEEMKELHKAGSIVSETRLQMPPGTNMGKVYRYLDSQ